MADRSHLSLAAALRPTATRWEYPVFIVATADALEVHLSFLNGLGCAVLYRDRGAAERFIAQAHTPGLIAVELLSDAELWWCLHNLPAKVVYVAWDAGFDQPPREWCEVRELRDALIPS